MSLKKHIAIALTAIGLLAGGAVASAQTTTDTTGVTASTTTTGTTATPGTPNTGAGGDAAANWAILAVTGIVVIGGVAYLMRKPQVQ
ncbi:MAG TPA: hypothetical protein VN701_02220 [Candidatus Paceibacterota bacterium]|nr:hypothetical protein [Candidatus Paceibacterota bacterium]